MNKYLQWGLFVAIATVIWFILDVLYTALLMRQAYGMPKVGEIIISLVTSVVLGYFLFVREKKNKEDK